MLNGEYGTPAPADQEEREVGDGEEEDGNMREGTRPRTALFVLWLQVSIFIECTCVQREEVGIG